MEVVVCLRSDEPRPRQLLEAGASLADGLRGRLSAVVVQPDGEAGARRAEELWALAREFTDACWRLRSDEPEPALRHFVRVRRATLVVR